MNTELNCWACGEMLRDLILPLSRREECAVCGADQHACKMCLSFDANVARQCLEDRAEDVSNKESANFCDYFAPNPKADARKSRGKHTEVSEQLAALFGEGPEENPQKGKNEQEAAMLELEKLFKKDN